MELLIALFFLVFFLAIMTVVGHLIWVVIAAVLRWILKKDEEPPPARQTRIFEAPDDLAAFERQLVRFHREGKIIDEIYELLLAKIRSEREPRRRDKAESPQTDIADLSQ